MIEAYPLYWPEGRKRTPLNLRAHNRSFSMGFEGSRDSLVAEVNRMGARDVIISTNIPLRRDGLPLANASEPTDCGVDEKADVFRV